MRADTAKIDAIESRLAVQSPGGLDVDICIVGAGPVGGTLACLLAGMGISTAIIDRAPLPRMEHPDFDGRAYAIAASGQKLMADSGLWDGLPEKPCPIHDIRVTDGKVGRPASSLFLHFDHREAGSEPFGWMVEARSLRVALNARMHALPGLHLFAPAEASVERRQDGAVVRVAGGPEISCRLVVAAEGRMSSLRSQANIPITRLPYGQTGMVGAIAHELPHDNTALEHFLPAGPFAQLPLEGNADHPHISAYVWTERDRDAARLIALDDERFGAELGRRLGDHLGAIKVIGRRWSYPLSAMFAHRYYATRLALVGDAAHGVHPIAGQGLNLGFRDVACLAGLIGEAVGSSRDPGSVGLLTRYQRARRPDNMMMLAGMDALDRLFSNDIPPIRLARDLGIAAVHRIGPLKRLFMRQAMGVLTG